MSKGFLGDIAVEACFYGDEFIDTSFFGDFPACEPSDFFHLTIQMIPGVNKPPTIPNFSIESGAPIDPSMMIYEDRGNGLWDVISYEKITHFWWGYKHKNIGIEELVVNRAEHLTSCYGIFWDQYVNLKKVDFSRANMSKVTTLEKMFEDCSGMIDCNISNWDLQSLTSVTYLYEGCTALQHLDLSNIKLGHVLDFESFMEDCIGLRHIVELDTRSGTNKHLIFANTNFVQPDYAARQALASSAGEKWRHPDAPSEVKNFSCTDLGTGEMIIGFTPATGNPVPTHSIYRREGRKLIASNVQPGDKIRAACGIQVYYITSENTAGYGHAVINGNKVRVHITMP